MLIPINELVIYYLQERNAYSMHMSILFSLAKVYPLKETAHYVKVLTNVL